jgi:hypothetical protein
VKLDVSVRQIKKACWDDSFTVTGYHPNRPLPFSSLYAIVAAYFRFRQA